MPANQRPLPVFPQESITEGAGPLNVAWDRFMRTMYQRTGGASGVPTTTVQPGITGGSSIGNAPVLTNDFNPITSGTFVRLQSLQPAQTQEVNNLTGGNLTVLPPSNSAQIDALGVGNGYVIANGKTQRFTAQTITQLHSLQLG